MDLILQTIRGLAALDFEPGARYTYSNTNYMLLRAVAERVGGARFDRQIEHFARGFADIDTRAPEYSDGLRQSPSRVSGYDVAPDGGNAPSLSNWDVLGASSVWVSVEDLARWGEALMRDRARFERQAEIGILRYPDQDQDRGYAAGLMTLRRDGERIVYHLGGTEGFSSGLFMRPDHDEVMAFSCNMSPELFFARGMAGEARSALERGRELAFLDVWLNAQAQ
jgi:CubicO group peptidase (beta-lactamase class C family)